MSTSKKSNMDSGDERKVSVLLVHGRSTTKMERYEEVALKGQREVMRSFYIERDAVHSLTPDESTPKVIEVTVRAIDPESLK